MSVAEISSILPEPLPVVHATHLTPGELDAPSPARREASTVPTVDDSGTPADAGAALSAFLLQIRDSSADQPASSTSENDGTAATSGIDRSDPTRTAADFPASVSDTRDTPPPQTVPADGAVTSAAPGDRTAIPLSAGQTRSDDTAPSRLPDANAAPARDEDGPATDAEAALSTLLERASSTSATASSNAATQSDSTPTLADAADRTQAPRTSLRDQPISQESRAAGETPSPDLVDTRGSVAAEGRPLPVRPAETEQAPGSATLPPLAPRDASSLSALDGRSATGEAGALANSPARPRGDAPGDPNGSASAASSTPRAESAVAFLPEVSQPPPAEVRDARPPTVADRVRTGGAAGDNADVGGSPAPEATAVGEATNTATRPPLALREASTLPASDRGGGAEAAVSPERSETQPSDLLRPLPDDPTTLESRLATVANTLGSGKTAGNATLAGTALTPGPTAAERAVTDHRLSLVLREASTVSAPSDGGTGAEAGAALSAFLIQARGTSTEPTLTPASANGNPTEDTASNVGLSSPTSPSRSPSVDVATLSPSGTATDGTPIVKPADMAVLSSALLASGLIPVAMGHGVAGPAEDTHRAASGRIARVAQVSGSPALTAGNGGSGNSLLKHARTAYAIGEIEPDLDGRDETFL